MAAVLHTAATPGATLHAAASSRAASALTALAHALPPPAPNKSFTSPVAPAPAPAAPDSNEGAALDDAKDDTKDITIVIVMAAAGGVMILLLVVAMVLVYRMRAASRKRRVAQRTVRTADKQTQFAPARPRPGVAPV